MTSRQILTLLLSAVAITAATAQESTLVYESESLRIEKYSDHVYVHISTLYTDEFGEVPCNGMIVVNQNEALVFDTPVADEPAFELIFWLEYELGCEILGIVPTHFHVDCLGGLNAFHDLDIPSFAYKKTIALAEANGAPVPEHAFDALKNFQVGDLKVICTFFGEGHTSDNIVVSFPEEKTLFGGCLIKAKGAGKGNLADANTRSWANTVRLVKLGHLTVKLVIPGHGSPGTAELLDYTIELFDKQ